MRVENNNVSGQNHDPEQIDLIDLLVQLWCGKMTIIISVIVAIALAIGYLAVTGSFKPSGLFPPALQK